MTKKSEKTKFKIYNIGSFIVGVVFLAICICSFIPIWVGQANQNSHGLVITQQFYVSSTQKNSEYETKIVGKIKNTNNHVVEDIVLYFDIETLREDSKTTAKITIDSIQAGEEYYVSVKDQSDKNYSILKKMMVQIGQGEKVEIGFGDSVLYTIIGGLVMMLIPILMIINSLRPSKSAKYKTDQEVEEIKAEMEKKIKKLKKAKYVKCEYCGLKNKIDATRCEGCGAMVEYNIDE